MPGIRSLIRVIREIDVQFLEILEKTEENRLLFSKTKARILNKNLCFSLILRMK